MGQQYPSRISEHQQLPYSEAILFHSRVPHSFAVFE
jgi:hypothetical protein